MISRRRMRYFRLGSGAGSTTSSRLLVPFTMAFALSLLGSARDDLDNEYMDDQIGVQKNSHTFHKDADKDKYKDQNHLIGVVCSDTCTFSPTPPMWQP